MKSGLAAGMLIALAGSAIAQDGGGLKPQNKPDYGYIEGKVVGITADSEMIVDLSNGIKPNGSFAPENTRVFMRQWALTIKPRNLAVIVFGRRVWCTGYYQTGRTIVGDCNVVIVEKDVQAPKESIFPYLALPGHYLKESASVRGTAIWGKLGEDGCTEDDERNLPYPSGQGDFFKTKCPGIKEDN